MRAEEGFDQNSSSTDVFNNMSILDATQEHKVVEEVVDKSVVIDVESSFSNHESEGDPNTGDDRTGSRSILDVDLAVGRRRRICLVVIAFIPLVVASVLLGSFVSTEMGDTAVLESYTVDLIATSSPSSVLVTAAGLSLAPEAMVVTTISPSSITPSSRPPSTSSPTSTPSITPPYRPPTISPTVTSTMSPTACISSGLCDNNAMCCSNICKKDVLSDEMICKENAAKPEVDSKPEDNPKPKNDSKPGVDLKPEDDAIPGDPPKE